MSTLVNIVLAVVLNFFSYGNIQQTNAVASNLETTRLANSKVYQLKDLRSCYVITKNELIKSSIEIN